MTDVWKILKRELMFSAMPWFQVMKETIVLPNGKVIDDFYQIDQPDYVEILAMNAEQKICGFWHYKHGVRKEHLGLPAGYLNPTETPLAAAQRELLEECQLQSASWKKLGEFILEGNRSTAKGHIFLAENCTVSALQVPSDDLEVARSAWLSIDEWLNYIVTQEVAVIGSATAILLLQHELRLRII